MANSISTVDQEDTAIYVRVSTTKDSQKDSPEHQKGTCEEVVRELKLNVVAIYEDRDTGTSIVQRNSIQQLLEDAKIGKFKTVIFASLSRFSRDLYDALDLKRKLVDALGIRLISIEESFDSHSLQNKDEFKFQIISAVNQKLSEQISISSRRGIRQSAMKGNFTGTIPPYGYKKATIGERKTLVPDEVTSPIVKTIYSLYTEHGYGEKAVTNYLNEHGIPAYKGGSWGVTSVQRILINEVYTGVNVFSKNKGITVIEDVNNISDRRKKQIQTDVSDWDRSEFKTHEAIIDDKTFQLAQGLRLIRGGGKRGGARQRKNALSGTIFCSHCGSAMVTMKSKEYRYLVCSLRRRKREYGCTNNKWIPYKEVRDQIIDDLKGKMKVRLEHLKASDNTFDKNIRITEKNDSPEKGVKKLEKSIENNRNLLFELRKQHMSGKIDDKQFEYEYEIYNKEITQMESKITSLQSMQKLRYDMIQLKTDFEKYFNEITHLDNDDYDKVKMILSYFVERIDVNMDGEIEVTYYHSLV